MNIANLEAYVESRNAWAKIFGNKQLSLLNKADRQAIANALDADLSPENLTCDGEVRGQALRNKQNFLFRCAEELISIDPTVTFYELSV
jgi:hypothetical protein